MVPELLAARSGNCYILERKKAEVKHLSFQTKTCGCFMSQIVAELFQAVGRRCRGTFACCLTVLNDSHCGSSWNLLELSSAIRILHCC